MTPAEEQLARLTGIPIHQHTARVGQYDINYVEAGSGAPLLLIHGANIGWGQWYANIGELARRFHVFALDLPGCGRSSRIDFRAADVERDFIAVVREFIKQTQMDSPVVLGHSFGAVIAMKLALDKNPNVSKLILVSPLGFSGYINPKQRLATILPLAKLVSRTVMSPTKDNMYKFLRDAVHHPQSISPEFLEYYHQSVSANKNSHPLLFINGLTKRLKMKPEIILVRELPRIKIPTLIVMGTKDRIIPPPKVAHTIKTIPDSKVVVYPMSGHVPNLERPEEFNAEVTNFILSGT